jgi:hypothetical protein
MLSNAANPIAGGTTAVAMTSALRPYRTAYSSWNRVEKLLPVIRRGKLIRWIIVRRPLNQFGHCPGAVSEAGSDGWRHL